MLPNNIERMCIKILREDSQETSYKNLDNFTQFLYEKARMQLLTTHYNKRLAVSSISAIKTKRIQKKNFS